jgi:hypothetical protein
MILTQFGLNTYEEMMHNALHPDRLTNTRDHVLPGFIKNALDKYWKGAGIRLDRVLPLCFDLPHSS